MRANPYAGTDIADETYMGDNFIRNTGDAVNFDDVNKFAWQSREINGQKSDLIHLQSNPTMTELAFKQFNSKKESIQDKFKNNLTQRYGNHSNNISQQDIKLIYGQSEEYREYGADGRITKGQPELIASSKYEEDKYPGNHTSIWGSYYDLKTNKWGYACCHCVVFNAYCTGDDGINANKEKDKYKVDVVNGDKKKQINNIGVVPKPKEMENEDKLVNPSGYISTRGIMAAKGIARKVQKQQELEEKRRRKAKKRAKKKKKKLRKRELRQDDDDGYGGEVEREESNEPLRKRAKLSSEDE